MRGLNLDKIININDKVVEMYSDYSDDSKIFKNFLDKPFIGEELNKPAEITFFNI